VLGQPGFVGWVAYQPFLHCIWQDAIEFDCIIFFDEIFKRQTCIIASTGLYFQGVPLFCVLYLKIGIRKDKRYQDFGVFVIK